jgi:hypothetical protein
MNIYIRGYCTLNEEGYPSGGWVELIKDVPLAIECQCYEIEPAPLVCDPAGPQALSIYLEITGVGTQTPLNAPGDYNISVSLYANNAELKD